MSDEIEPVSQVEVSQPVPAGGGGNGRERRGDAPVGLAAALAFNPPSSAGPPFVTDDPEAVEAGHGEFYVAG